MSAIDSGLIGKYRPVGIKKYEKDESTGEFTIDATDLDGTGRQEITVNYSRPDEDQRARILEMIEAKYRPKLTSISDPAAKDHIKKILDHLRDNIGNLYLVDYHRLMQGYGDSEHILLNEDLFNYILDPITQDAAFALLFHEAGHSYFAANPTDQIPAGLNVHTYLRGLGKKARPQESGAVEAVRERTAIEQLLPDGKGLQDMLVGEEVNERATELIEKLPKPEIITSSVIEPAVAVEKPSIKSRLGEIGVSEEEARHLLAEISKLEGEDAVQANVILDYLIGVYDAAKKALDKYSCDIGEERNIIIPVSGKFLPLVPEAGKARAQALWTEIKGILNKNHFNINLVTYDGTLADLKNAAGKIDIKTKKVGKEEKEVPNTIAFIDYDDTDTPEKAGALKNELRGMIVFPVKAHKEGGHISIGGHISLGLGVLAIAESAPEGDSETLREYCKKVAELIDALDGDKKRSILSAYAGKEGFATTSFIADLIEAKIVITLPPILPFDLEKQTKLHFVMERALSTAL